MRLMLRGAVLTALVALVGACADRPLVSPTDEAAPSDGAGFTTTPPPAVRFSEIHYDNAGTDAGEAIEVSGPAGTFITGWRVVLYNGAANSLAAYSTRTLSGFLPETCDGRGVTVIEYATNGIQNGDPDGFALVNAAGEVVEFLSYGGTFTAADGPAAGLTSTDIGVKQSSTTPLGHSLQRNGAGTWSGPQPNTFGACNDDDEPPPPPPPPPPPSTFISELHYDNIGTDVGEAVEIEGPAGLDLTGWQVLLYNGAATSRAVYDTRTLSVTIPALCDGRGVLVLEYPTNGIQNGDPDGVALVNASGEVVEFISYGGVFVAASGPAAGMTSVDIGVRQSNTTTPVGHSLQRNASGVWEGPLANSFGACNGAPPPPPPPPPAAAIVISELMGDPANAESASWGEWFEVHNTGATPVNLQGWTIASQGQPNHVIASTVIVPAGGYAVLGRGADPARNGGVTLDYNYFTGSATTIWLDNADWLVLRDGLGATQDSVRWSSLPRGVTKAVRNFAADNANVDGPNWGFSTVPFGAGDLGTPGAPNGTLADAPPLVTTLTFSGRSATGDPPLPVGFEFQLFATLRNNLGDVVPTTFTWLSETPALVSVDARGVVRALGAGTARVRATAADGTTNTFSFPTIVAQPSTSASYVGNAEFGEPFDSDPSDDFIIRRPQYTASYNRTRGTPNWVSYNLETTHFGPEDRCNCFSPDPELPASFPLISTADYTGAGAFAGYGIDRGHLVRSADRTSGSFDNAVTFYFTNIIPQTADQNQGPWAVLETYLADIARRPDREVYIVTGVAGSLGTVKDEGLIVMPAQVWKVAVIMPRDQGLAHVRTWRDLEVVAVMMPNVPGIRNTPWQTYLTTVDAIEAASGYDLLDLLPDDIERIIESGTRAPMARLNGPFSGLEGSAIAMSGAASSDPDGDALTFSWSFGDGSNGSGTSVTHTYSQDGTYTVRLVVTDVWGAADTTYATATVANVAPVVSALPAATLIAGETYRANGSFTDPGADPWTATVDYGAGSGAQPLTLAGKAFTLSHTYATAGSYTVTVRVNDDDAFGTSSTTVTVLTTLQAVGNIAAMVDALAADGVLRNGEQASLKAKLSAAARQFTRDGNAPAENQLGAFINEVEALQRSGRLASSHATALIDAARRLMALL